jgi:hypothetical protein
MSEKNICGAISDLMNALDEISTQSCGDYQIFMLLDGIEHNAWQESDKNTPSEITE